MEYLLYVIIIIFLILLFLYKNKKRPDKGKILMIISTKNIKIKGELKMISITSTQEQDLQIMTTDRLGHPAPVEEGSVVFTSSNEEVFTVIQDPDDQTKALVKAIGPGVAQLDVKADADLGEGVVEITGFTGVEILPAMAAGFGFVAGEVREQTV